MTPFDLSTLPREPEHHLNQLLELLATVPDGFTTKRAEVRMEGRFVPGWNVDDDNYVISVNPEYQCGFDEEGDGKVLTAILNRVVQREGQVSLTTTPRFRDSSTVGPYFYIAWRAGVKLGVDVDTPITRKVGLAYCDKPGTALLCAYLMAWGMVE